MTEKSSDDKRLPFSISLVIPTYNNASTIKAQLNICEKIMNELCDNYEIIISNDASKDKTKEILEKNFAENPHFKIINQQKNLGISNNIKFLYRIASCDYIALFSIDGAWNPQDISRLARFAYEKHADIVIGKRVKKEYPLSRKIVSVFYNSLIFLLFGVKTYDTGSIKIFKKKVFQKVKLISKSVFFEGEMIIKAQKKGYSIAYLPIDHYRTRKNLKSGVNRKLVLSSLRDLIILRFQKL